MPRAAKSRAPLRPNRSDLNRPAPITTVPGQGYGEAAQQRAAQQVIPMGPQPISGPPRTGPQPSPTPPQGSSPVLPIPPPGSNGPIDRPTERPNEPVTHGLPIGPGAGPEALTGIGAAAREGVVQQGTLRNLLTSMASQPGATQAIQDLAARAVGGVQ